MLCIQLLVNHRRNFCFISQSAISPLLPDLPDRALAFSSFGWASLDTTKSFIVCSAHIICDSSLHLSTRASKTEMPLKMLAFPRVFSSCKKQWGLRLPTKQRPCALFSLVPLTVL